MIRAVISRLRTSQTGATRTGLAIAVIVGMLATLLAIPAFAVTGLASLAGSTFEIDDNANLKLDNEGYVDWGTLAHPNGPELRATDKPTGQNDDSYRGGVKEDTECPGETTGSIPNNKSDLLTFHVYEEPGTGSHPGFLNLAWSRVSDPSGTTLMDFEFNQSGIECATGPNKLRTEGDLLIEYAIDQGGARANISGRFWTGTAWGPSQDLDVPSADCDGDPCAVGTINSSVIPAAESDGLGEKQARTFGEAQIDLRLIFEPNECVSFGSAMLKSRSSDAFTSQLKDFISPVDIDLQNCGNVIIRKQTDPDGATDTFDFTKSFPTDPSTSNTFSLADDGVKDFNDDVLFGTGYTVSEDVLNLPTGWDFVSVDCSASTGVTPSITGAEVTFDIDADTDVLDCTYFNEARGTIIVEKIADAAGDFDFTSGTLTPASFTLSPTGAGTANKDSKTFSDLTPGTYDVDETVPDDWNLDSATCDDGSDPSSIGLDAGETVTCTFSNLRETGAIVITKMRKHAADGPGDHPHQGVDFTITGGELDAEGITVTTDANGEACVEGLVLSSFVGDYTVTEDVPDGYVVDDGEQDVTVSLESECGDGNEAEVEFNNTPLTDITVTVTSQVDGGTKSSVECVLGAEVLGGTDGLYVTDPEIDLTDLEPGTYVCTVVVDP